MSNYPDDFRGLPWEEEERAKRELERDLDEGDYRYDLERDREDAQ